MGITGRDRGGWGVFGGGGIGGKGYNTLSIVHWASKGKRYRYSVQGGDMGGFVTCNLLWIAHLI